MALVSLIVWLLSLFVVGFTVGFTALTFFAIAATAFLLRAVLKEMGFAATMTDHEQLTLMQIRENGFRTSLPVPTAGCSFRVPTSLGKSHRSELSNASDG